MKRFLPFLFALFVLSLAGCGKATPRNYLNDLSAAELADLADDSLSEDFRAADADYLTEYVSLPQAGYSLSVRLATGGDRIDEYGILHSDIGTEEAARLLRDYLARSYEQNRTFYDSYIPTETPKLRDAEVRIYGDYVVYAILSPEEKAAFFSRVEECLRKS
ncbi:MAG TPA: hypothetical protein DDW30_03870 [Clostridiales bacterium]|nr:hypothetical protein [Clostridiales bacterium]